RMFKTLDFVVLCLCLKISQTPKFTFLRVGQSVTVECSQDAGYSYMHWYRQQSIKEMRLVLFTTVKLGRKSSQNCSLSIQGIQTTDAGVYFCACSTESLYVPSFVMFTIYIKITLLLY
uniref:Ig-like domain-containing protein n=1 Tax=Erpetoichthys calabaricus TaxID=27687 RepID=A0A8C4RSM7_ERPCA